MQTLGYFQSSDKILPDSLLIFQWVFYFYFLRRQRVTGVWHLRHRSLRISL